MFRRSRIEALGAGSACILLFYVLPSLIEIRLAPRVGAFNAYVLLGDALGCAVLSLVHRRTGIALYLVLTLMEAVLLRAGYLGVSALAWITDLMPAATLAVLAAMMVATARNTDDEDETWI